MGSCKECFHQPVCFKQGIRNRITPQGFELVCPHFKNIADFQKVKHGEWIYNLTYYESDECNCSLCGQLMTTAKGVRMNYCPNCGAKMDGGDTV